MSLAKVNAKIAHRGIELVKGQGYFYFAILDGFPDTTPEPASIMVPHFSHMPLDQWLKAAEAN